MPTTKIPSSHDRKSCEWCAREKRARRTEALWTVPPVVGFLCCFGAYMLVIWNI